MCQHRLLIEIPQFSPQNIETLRLFTTRNGCDNRKEIGNWSINALFIGCHRIMDICCKTVLHCCRTIKVTDEDDDDETQKKIC